VLDSTSTQAFCDELEKIAKALQTYSVEELSKKLKPGDILTTQRRTTNSWGESLNKVLLGFFQGTPYTHTGLYIGDGDIVDAGKWGKGDKAETRVHKVKLKDFAKRYKIRALRVRGSNKVKKDAVAYAKEQVGKDYNMSGVLRLAFPVFGKVKATERIRKKVVDELFCSELVANAYSAVNIAKDRALKHVRPVDIQRSPLTKSVVEFN